MVSFIIGLRFSIKYLNQASKLQRILGDLVVRIEDRRFSTTGWNLPRHIGNFFLLKLKRLGL